MAKEIKIQPTEKASALTKLDNDLRLFSAVVAEDTTAGHYTQDNQGYFTVRVSTRSSALAEMTIKDHGYVIIAVQDV